jgi:hypothetical protein
MGIVLHAHVDVDLRGLEQFQSELDAQLSHQSEGPITKAFNQWAVRYRSFIKERFDLYSKGGGDWAPLKDSTKKRRRVGKGVGPKPRKPLLKKLKSGRAIPKNLLSKGPTGKSNKAKAGALRSRINTLTKQLAKVGKSKKGFFARIKKRFEIARKLRKARASFRKSKRAALVKQNNKARASYKKAFKKWLNKRKFSILRDTNTMFNALSPVFQGKPGQLQEGIPFGIRVGFGGASRHPKGKATIADIANFHQTGAGYLPVRMIIVAPPQNVLDAMTSDMSRAIKQLAKDDSSSDGNTPSQ